MEYIMTDQSGIIVDHCCGGILPEGAVKVPDGFSGCVGMNIAALLPDFSGVKPISQQVEEGLLTIPEGMKANADDNELVRMSQEEIDEAFPVQTWAVPGEFHAVSVHKSFARDGGFGYFPPDGAVLMKGEQPGRAYKAGEDGTWILDAEKKEEMDVAEATEASTTMLSARVMRSMAQTESFSVSEFATLAKAKQFPEWRAETEYAAKQRIIHEGIVYEVVQNTTAQEHQPPSAEGMLAVYRPLSSVGSYGMDGTRGMPFEFIYGMDVHKGEYFTCDGKLWLATNDMLPCTWLPGSVGAWWEEVTE